MLVAQAEKQIEVRRRSGRGWTVETKRTGEIVTIHGHAIAVDDVYR